MFNPQLILDRQWIRLSNLKLKGICFVSRERTSVPNPILNINTKYTQPSFRGVHTNGTNLRDLQTFPGDKLFPCQPVRSLLVRDDLPLIESDKLRLCTLNDVMVTSSTWDVKIILTPDMLKPSHKAVGNARSWLRLISEFSHLGRYPGINAKRFHFLPFSIFILQNFFPSWNPKVLLYAGAYKKNIR